MRYLLSLLMLALLASASRSQQATFTVAFPGVARGTGWAKIDPQGKLTVNDLANGLTLALDSDGPCSTRYKAVSNCGALVTLEIAKLTGEALVVVVGITGQAPQVGGHWRGGLKGLPLTLGLERGWNAPDATYVVWPGSVTIK